MFMYICDFVFQIGFFFTLFCFPSRYFNLGLDFAWFVSILCIFSFQFGVLNV